MDTQTTINTDLHTPAAYRTLDQLENFRIVVKLKRLRIDIYLGEGYSVFCSGCIEGLPLLSNAGSTLKDGSAHASLGYLPQPLEETIRWQKKIPGPKDKGFTKPPKSSPDFIFTYVDTDGYEDEENTVRNLTDGIKDCPSIHLKRLSEMTQIPKGKDAAPMTKPKRRPLLNTKYRIMHIMACLRIGMTRESTYVQYKKKTVENGYARYDPGISATGQTNEFVIEDDIFQFTIENGSRSLSPEDEEKNGPSIPTITQNDVEILLHINGQLRCSRNFIKSNLYVRYFMDLPGPSWGTLGTMPFIGLHADIAVGSVDWWDRNRGGYGYLDIPKKSGE
ncbi:hypothetical protein BC829DRAFT_492516 [Chytridium lagenaria]|nr:hypothetical protein BC829DRAFT_492516 [Chytridium lagenaria]